PCRTCRLWQKAASTIWTLRFGSASSRPPRRRRKRWSSSLNSYRTPSSPRALQTGSRARGCLSIFFAERSSGASCPNRKAHPPTSHASSISSHRDDACVSLEYRHAWHGLLVRYDVENAFSVIAARKPKFNQTCESSVQVRQTAEENRHVLMHQGTGL